MTQHRVNQKHKKRLDKDGVPIDRRDWQEADWADLHYGITAIKARIGRRHQPESMPAKEEQS